MIKFFQKYETDKYVIIKILFIKITFKKKMPSMNLGYINKELNDIYNYRNIENNLYFSIIVPIYNTERYLRRCLDSLVNQTFKDIKIIIVNDASQGNCKEIIEEYKKKDNRIKYIEHSENKSLLQARKTGNIASTGKYIMYVDSDDEIESIKRSH
ncbi:MAG: glycosyltransferase family 2 protein [Brachyspira sp.]|nr:glycosyltransferase family 2 protein [Brachyspira sp.]